MGWLTVTGHGVALAALLGASSPVKVGLVAADLVGVVAICFFYLGRIREWDRISRHIGDSRSERRADAPSVAFAGLPETRRQAA